MLHKIRLREKARTVFGVCISQKKDGLTQQRTYTMSKASLESFAIFCKGVNFSMEEEISLALEFGGKLAGIQSYNENKEPHGPWEYYQEGMLIAKGNREKSEKQGTWEYYENGRLKEKINYDAGKKHGHYFSMEYEGKDFKIQIGKYDQGQKTGEWQIQEPGKSQKGVYVNDKKQGIWATRNSKGKIVSWEDFNEGEIQVSGKGVEELKRYLKILTKANVMLKRAGIPKIEQPLNVPNIGL